MHNNRDEIETYIRHKKEVQQRTLMDMTKIFDIEDMIYAIVWKLICLAIDEQIPLEQRKEFVYKIIDKQLDKWL